MTTQDSTAVSVLYTASVEVSGGRGGTATSRTGRLKVDLARPAERGTGAGSDPEELFAAAYAACFDSALLVASRRYRVPLGPTTTTASVSLTATPESKYAISVQIEVRAPECDHDQLDRLVALADELCPYSNGIRGNVPVTLRAVGRA